MLGQPLCREPGDLVRLFVGSVVFPEPGHRCQVILEFRPLGDRPHVFVYGDGRARGGADADADDGIFCGRPPGLSQELESFASRRDESLFIVKRSLAGQQGVGGIRQDTVLSAAVGSYAACDFSSATGIDNESAGSIGAVIKAKAEPRVLHGTILNLSFVGLAE